MDRTYYRLFSFRDDSPARVSSNVPKDWNEWREKPLSNRSHTTLLATKAPRRPRGRGFMAEVIGSQRHADAASPVVGKEMGALRVRPAHGQLGWFGLIGAHTHCLWNVSAKTRYIPKILRR